MNRIRTLLAVTLALLLGACRGNEAATTKPGSTEAAATDTATAQVRDGVQTAEVSVGEAGFSPSTIAFRAGTPARLVVTRRTEQTCATEVKAPELGLAPTSLPLNEPVVLDFTPDSTGTFTFACGMDMVKGAVLVRQM